MYTTHGQISNYRRFSENTVYNGCGLTGEDFGHSTDHSPAMAVDLSLKCGTHSDQIPYPKLTPSYQPIVQQVSKTLAYCTPNPVPNLPENNHVHLLEYRGSQLAAFTVAGRELVCLPQAFEIFLKHLVGGLHTVYTKLKRLEIVPVVCNVEQVRILRGLGAIQPGVNRCKLIAPHEFDILYADCTNSSARPGRPSKRLLTGTSPTSAPTTSPCQINEPVQKITRIAGHSLIDNVPKWATIPSPLSCAARSTHLTSEHMLSAMSSSYSLHSDLMSKFLINGFSKLFKPSDYFLDQSCAMISRSNRERNDDFFGAIKRPSTQPNHSDVEAALPTTNIERLFNGSPSTLLRDPKYGQEEVRGHVSEEIKERNSSQSHSANSRKFSEEQSKRNLPFSACNLAASDEDPQDNNTRSSPPNDISPSRDERNSEQKYELQLPVIEFQSPIPSGTDVRRFNHSYFEAIFHHFLKSYGLNPETMDMLKSSSNIPLLDLRTNLSRCSSAKHEFMSEDDPLGSGPTHRNTPSPS